MSNPDKKAPTALHDALIFENIADMNKFLQGVPLPLLFPPRPPMGKTMFGAFEVFTSRHCPPDKIIFADLGDIERAVLESSFPMFRSPPDEEKLAVVKDIASRFLAESRAAINAINERRRRESLIANYEQQVKDYEAEQMAYAEDKAPTMLASVPPNIVDIDERMAQAVELAKALYRRLNAAPEHPFPPVPVDHEAELAAQTARGVDIACQAAQHLIGMGAAKAEIPVVVNGEKFVATVERVAPDALPENSDTAAAQ